MVAAWPTVVSAAPKKTKAGPAKKAKVTKAADEAPSGEPKVIVATVNGEEIDEAEVEQVVQAATGGREVAEEAIDALRASALDQVINRRLVAADLDREKKSFNEEELDGMVEGLTKQLERQQTTLEKFLADRKLTIEALRRQMAWDARWRLRLEKELTDEALEKFFEDHRQDLDGTEVRVSHILLRVEESSNPDSLAITLDKAKKLRGQLEAGELTFAEAAEKYSSGPSRKRGGDLGFIPRHDQMVEAFSAAAFALQQQEISQPVVTPFGVHLIQCTEIKPGEKTWQDVRAELEVLLAQDLFARLADKLRKKATITFTGAMPYFDAQSRQLIHAPAP